MYFGMCGRLLGVANALTGSPQLHQGGGQGRFTLRQSQKFCTYKLSECIKSYELVGALTADALSIQVGSFMACSMCRNCHMCVEKGGLSK